MCVMRGDSLSAWTSAADLLHRGWEVGALLMVSDACYHKSSMVYTGIVMLWWLWQGLQEE